MKKKNKKRIKKILKSALAGVFIMVLGTAGIDAVDHYDNMPESLIGRMIFGKSESVCPEDMVFVQASWGDFCIDKYEASVGKDCPYPEPKSSTESKYNIDNPECKVDSKADAIPWTNLVESQALSACMKAGKRLPTNKEWSYAAMGTPDPNDGWKKDDCQVANNWDEQPGLTGSGQNCQSFAGAYDMIGNVWEWVDGSVTDGVFEGKELPQEGYVNGVTDNNATPSETSGEKQELYNHDFFWIKNTKTRAIARGGYWNNMDQAGQYSHYIVSSPTDSGNATGFRCVKNANTKK